VLAVDSGVLASLFIDSPASPGARSLFEADPEWHSDAYSLVEFTNILAAQVKNGRLVAPAAPPLVAAAEHVLSRGLHQVETATALTLAIRHQVSTYDARFLAVAIMLQKKLVTEDAALRQKAPALTQSIDEALARSLARP